MNSGLGMGEDSLSFARLLWPETATRDKERNIQSFLSVFPNWVQKRECEIGLDMC